MIYQLTTAGRAVTWKHWLKIGGCGMCHNNVAVLRLGPVSRWPKDITLGQIADVDPAEGRGFARFATEHLNKPAWAEPYVSPDYDALIQRVRERYEADRTAS